MKINGTILLYGITAVIAIVVIVFLIKTYGKGFENYQIVLGTAHNQQKFYGKCIDDCWRDLNGDSSPGQFKWLCTEKCQEVANARMSAGVPDLTDAEFEKHNSMNATNKGYYACPQNTLDPYELSKCYCLDERLNWCKEVICPFNRNSQTQCVADCMRTRAVDCMSMQGGGQPF